MLNCWNHYTKGGLQSQLLLNQRQKWTKRTKPLKESERATIAQSPYIVNPPVPDPPKYKVGLRDFLYTEKRMNDTVIYRNEANEAHPYLEIRPREENFLQKI